MGDSFLIRGKRLLASKIWTKNVQSVIKNNHIILVSIAFIIFGLMARIWDAQPVFYAHAYTVTNEKSANVESPLLEQPAQLFAKKDEKNVSNKADLHIKNKYQKESFSGLDGFSDRIYAIVGDAPIKEMVPFISKRNEKVAAFLIGIAKKESSFGSASPSKDGETCYNYWGYKGSGGNGTSMGYACFASAKEAVETVGNRIEVLINKDRNTPASMVHTWKCGRDCSGDPGAPGWVSTVALYFNKLVS
jgi:hypothetical protein